MDAIHASSGCWGCHSQRSIQLVRASYLLALHTHNVTSKSFTLSQPCTHPLSILPSCLLFVAISPPRAQFPPPPPYSPEPKLPSPSRLPPTPHPLPPPAREYTTHPPIVGKRAAGRPPSTPPLLQAQLSIYFPIHYHSPTPAKQQQTRAAPPAKASECQELRQCALVYRTSERGRRIHLQHSRKAAVHAPAVKRDGTHRYATKPPSQLPTLT